MLPATVIPPQAATWFGSITMTPAAFSTDFMTATKPGFATMDPENGQPGDR